MACPWFLLKEISLVTSVPAVGPTENNILYQLYPENYSTPIPGVNARSYVYPDDLTTCSSSIPHSYTADRGNASTLPFYRTVVIPRPPLTKTALSDKVKKIYQELSHLPVEYVACFERIKSMFIVCSDPETAKSLLQHFPTNKWFSDHVFTRKIYTPMYCSPERHNKIEAWSNVSLSVSIDENNLTLRVRSNKEPLKIFQDLCWQLQVNCHHLPERNNQDSEGETTLWVESSGSKKYLHMPLGKGKQPEKGRPGLEDQHVDRVIEIMRPLIQNLLDKDMVMVGLQLVFAKVQESEDFKKWLIASEVAGSNETANGNRSGGFHYPPLPPVSAIREAPIPVPPVLPKQGELDSDREGLVSAKRNDA